MRFRPWTCSEEESLIIMFEIGLSYREIGATLNRTEIAIRTRIYANNLRKTKKWTAEDIQFILDNPGMKSRTMAHRLGCSLSAIQTKRKKVASKG